MLDRFFQGIFSEGVISTVSVEHFLACIGAALGIGLVIAFAYMYRTAYTKSFLITIALLPAIVCVVIMMVNGSIGAGIAVAGAFSLVRFRSQPGTAKEILSIFLAMGNGLICGMGYLGFAALFTVLMSGIMLLYNRLALLLDRHERADKTLRILRALISSVIYEPCHDLGNTHAIGYSLYLGIGIPVSRRVSQRPHLFFII